MERSRNKNNSSKPIAANFSMLDQSHNIENSIDGIIYSVMNLKTVLAKALTIDLIKLRQYQAENGTMMSNKIMEAFETDVQPLIEHCRLEMGLSYTDPLENYRKGGHQQHIEKAREAGALTLGCCC